MGIRTAQYRNICQPRKLQIIYELTEARDESGILLSLERSPNPKSGLFLDQFGYCGQGKPLCMAALGRAGGRFSAFLAFLLHLLRRGLDRFHNVHVTSAPAEIPLNSSSDFLFAGIRVSLKKEER